jgi:hypothetical protein
MPEAREVLVMVRVLNDRNELGDEFGDELVV